MSIFEKEYCHNPSNECDFIFNAWNCQTWVRVSSEISTSFTLSNIQGVCENRTFSTYVRKWNYDVDVEPTLHSCPFNNVAVHLSILLDFSVLYKMTAKLKSHQVFLNRLQISFSHFYHNIVSTGYGCAPNHSGLWAKSYKTVVGSATLKSSGAVAAATWRKM